MIENKDNQCGYRIRKLTPKECWRLMGFEDVDFEKAKWYSKEETIKFLAEHPNHKGKRNFSDEERIERVSDSQLYKQAGNSIVVDVLYYIFKNLYIAMPYLFEDLKVGSYFSGIGAFEKGLDRLYEDINYIKQTNSLSTDIGNNAVVGGSAIIYDDYNSNIRKEQNTIGTLTTNIGHSSLRNAYKIIERI